jgi:hypothetical protein
MKITDLRCGRVLEGDLVDEIAGGQTMNDEQLEAYLNITPEHKDYHHWRRPAIHKTAVLKRADKDGYYVVPINPKFFKVEG